MSLECKNCRAIYSGKIYPFSKFVKCEYCGCIIVVPNTGNFQGVNVPEFTLESFGAFLNKRGIATFDHVSGILKIGNEQVIISKDGKVSGSKKLKLRVERWLQKFMS